MDAAADDVFRTIEFSRDRWRMSKVPWALLLLLAGLSYAIYFDPTPTPRGLLVMFLLMIAALIGVILTDLVFEAAFSAGSATIRAFAGAIVVLAVIALVLAWLTSTVGGRPRAPSEFPGWLIVFISLAWIAHALYRHILPERPQLAFSPQGLRYRAPGALDVLIPWREIESVGSLALAGLWQTAGAEAGRGATVFHVSQAFYERHLHVRNLLLRGPDWDNFFMPVDGSIRVLLNHEPFSVEARDIRVPLETRWKAFRDQPAPSVPAFGGIAAHAPRNRIVLGAWTWGSYWDLVPFLIPLAGIVTVIADALIRH